MKFKMFIIALLLFTNILVAKSTKINEAEILHRSKRQAPLGVETTYFDKNVEITKAAGRSGTRYPIKRILDGAPETPQIIRLRSNVSFHANEGRVEIYHKKSKKWGLICDDYWNLPDAHVACRQLGFQKGARDALRPHSFGTGNWTKKDYILDRIKCNGKENDIFHCSYHRADVCSGQSAGAGCIYNEGCPFGWLAFGGACYQVNEKPLKYKEAEAACGSQNSKLVYILRESENNFLSNVLYLQFPTKTKVWTGGYYANVTYDNGHSENKWNWYATIHNVDQWDTAGLWFPGFGEQRSDKRPMGDVETKSCVALNRLYANSQESNKIYDVNYYWWDNLSCQETLPFICQKNIPGGRSDCYQGSGSDYRGTISRTTHGTSCAKWSDPGAAVNDKTNPRAGLGDHNYCRNPDNDDMPWCYVHPSKNIYGYCAMVKCAETLPPPTTVAPIEVIKPEFGVAGCTQNQFYCPSMIPHNRQCLASNRVCNQIPDCIDSEDENPEFCKTFSCTKDEFFCVADMFCILNGHICDGKKHCSDGADEKNCTVDESIITEKFEKFDSKILHNVPMLRYANLPLQTCMDKCRIIYPEFKCRSFNYLPPNETRSYSECQLMEKVQSEVPDNLVMISYPGAHYSLKGDCKGKYKCSSGMCIADNEKCDGRNNCGDNSDEQDCTLTTVSQFEIRLTGTKNNWEGKIEVRYEGEWGYVCDDSIEMNTAHVICNQMGFLGAAELVKKAGFRFGKVRNPNILLDDVKCVGTELSLEDCPHAPWRKHNCKSVEIAGVVCNLDRACLITEFRCIKDKRCIKVNQICDGKNDCTDGTDEPEGKCNIKIELRNGPDHRSGVVHLIVAYFTGTICRDRFDDKDAAVICRTMGIDGRAQAVTDNRFGIGTGEILLSNLNCNGDELHLKDCVPLNWGEHRCSHADDVGVICGLPALKPDITTTVPTKTGDQVPGVTCGRRPISQARNRFLGGFETIYGAFPWQVGIRYLQLNYDVHWCGGTILSEQWILSAGHCFESPKTEYIIRTGDWNNNQPDTYEQSFEIEELLFHPKFKGPPIFDYDLVLIKVKKSGGIGIILNNYVQPACLPDLGMVPDFKTKCLVSGWGNTQVETTEILLAAEVPLIKEERCNVFYKNRVNSRMQCAGYELGRIDTCQGDSGGPLVCQVSGIFTVFGATSWGDDCARPQSPGVYAKVQVMRDWIKEVTGY